MATETDPKKVSSHCWRNTQTPFALPILKPPISNLTSFLSPPELHKSFTTATDNCFRFLHSLASQNPFLNKILFLRSEFDSLCFQIRCSNYRSRKWLSSHNFAAVLPGDSVAGLVVGNGIQNFLNIYNTLLVVRLVLTWFPNSPPAIVGPLSTICDPYLNLFRGLIPPLGGTLDLSPILAFLVLNAFTSASAALPAELPVTQQSEQGVAATLQSTDITSSQKKWMKRLQGNRKTKSSDGAHAKVSMLYL
ncbi:LOW QUALITY PROTEIN: ylmG homolog protein 2, chloroplastic [Lotus japonicus]|uniref:LOW QUALITY PROTEIN: ylmG homolog protein 2, chloroplastic n=1 Tax=Lotus japonicus TaxID=34305 RepID=UPI00258684F3|nr:LOW QUALITY PROTEIN: ylmG homolog protein 2, chloroplastic [Lotus japonicus]